MPILPLYNTHGQLPGYRSRIKRCPQRFAEKQKEQTVKCHIIRAYFRADSLPPGARLPGHCEG